MNDTAKGAALLSDLKIFSFHFNDLYELISMQLLKKHEQGILKVDVRLGSLAMSFPCQSLF